jgi:hypothetical protein
VGGLLVHPPSVGNGYLAGSSPANELLASGDRDRACARLAQSGGSDIAAAGYRCVGKNVEPVTPAPSPCQRWCAAALATIGSFGSSGPEGEVPRSEVTAATARSRSECSVDSAQLTGGLRKRRKPRRGERSGIDQLADARSRCSARRRTRRRLRLEPSRCWSPSAWTAPPSEWRWTSPADASVERERPDERGCGGKHKSASTPTDGAAVRRALRRALRTHRIRLLARSGALSISCRPRSRSRCVPSCWSCPKPAGRLAMSAADFRFGHSSVRSAVAGGMVRRLGGLAGLCLL